MRHTVYNQEQFCIYGAGLQGRQICDNLLQAGFHVCCFLDKGRFQDPFYKGIPIVFFDGTMPAGCRDKTVIVSLIDPFDHAEIGQTLFESGFRRIICKRRILQHEQEFQVNALYDKLASYHGNISRVDILGAEFEQWENEVDEITDCAFLRQEGDYVVAYLPVEILYATGKPVIMQTQVLTLFEQLQGQNVDGTERFWQYACRVQGAIPKRGMEQERDRVICGRIKVYRSMVKAFSLDRDFFLRHPISVSWKGNVFEIKDGMHRALFQYMNGCRFLACSIPRAEYTRWLEETKSEVKKLQPGTAPVLHPYCYLWTAKTEDTYMTRMDAIFRFLAEEEISPKTALDLGENEGWTARNLCRAGIKTLCVVDAAEEGKLRTLDRVERTQVVTAHEIPGEELFDMALRLDLKKFTAATPECIQRLLRAAAYCVFFETADISSLNMIAGEYSVLKVSVNPEYPFEKLYLVAVKRSYTMN